MLHSLEGFWNLELDQSIALFDNLLAKLKDRSPTSKWNDGFSYVKGQIVRMLDLARSRSRNYASIQGALKNVWIFFVHEVHQANCVVNLFLVEESDSSPPGYNCGYDVLWQYVSSNLHNRIGMFPSNAMHTNVTRLDDQDDKTKRSRNLHFFYRQTS